MHHAFHEDEVTGEGADVGVVTGLSGDFEFQNICLAGLDELGVGHDIVGFRDVTFLQTGGIGHELHGALDDGGFFAWLDEDQVVRLRNGVSGDHEGDFDFGSGFDGEFLDVVKELHLVGSDGDLSDGILSHQLAREPEGDRSGDKS